MDACTERPQTLSASSQRPTAHPVLKLVFIPFCACLVGSGEGKLQLNNCHEELCLKEVADCIWTLCRRCSGAAALDHVEAEAV